MADQAIAAPRPALYSIAAHRGFADALVAGLVPRYRDPDLGLAHLTLLLPSSRARRTIAEAFIRHAGETGSGGLLMPRMAVIGDLQLDEALGTLLDPLGGADVPPAIDPRRRLFALAAILAEEMGDEAPRGATLLRLAREAGATMDRLLIEDIGPEQLLDESVITIHKDLSAHWQKALRLFAVVQAKWLAQLGAWGALDAAARRNRLFELAARRWSAAPPATPIVAAGITSAAPALARLLRVVSELPQGAVILPDLDLTMPDEVWDELGRAGQRPTPSDQVFAIDDAVTHPQYHLKLLLNRMGIARAEVQPWHRKGLGAAPPARSHAISSLFLPPEASKVWADLPPERRRLSGVRVMLTAHPEEEAQAIALLVREAIEVPQRRVAVVTPDRGLARRVIQHLARWDIVADDSAGRPLDTTPAGRLMLLLAEVMGSDAAAVPLMALLGHPLADGGMDRGAWLSHLRAVDRKLRGPRTRPGLNPVSEIVAKLAKDRPNITDWWEQVQAIVTPLLQDAAEGMVTLSDALDVLTSSAEALCGERIWAREDGRALSHFIEALRENARNSGFALPAGDLVRALADLMAQVAVRPPYGGHSRVQVLGLLEARGHRADLVICAGLNEGVWPARSGVDALLAPAVLRALGVPGADFRIGLAAHDLAGALGAPEVVLSRAARDDAGPAIPSRFLLRVQALLGDQLDRHRETRIVELARAMVRAPEAARYPRPRPVPTAEQRRVEISATALDRLRGDPYQFYAAQILRLKDLDALDAEPSPAWQGTVAHAVLERWHKAALAGEPTPISAFMDSVLTEANVHPLMRALWEPRLLAALRWVEDRVQAADGRKVAAVEVTGAMHVDGVRIHGRADRIDRLADGTLAIVDYKTGKPPSGKMTEQGYALQLGVLGLIAQAGGFAGLADRAQTFEYWSLGKSDKSDSGFGYIETPLKIGDKRSGVLPDAFLPLTEDFLREAIAKWIVGCEPFTARENPDYEGYNAFDQLMRLEEWLPHLDAETEETA